MITCIHIHSESVVDCILTNFYFLLCIFVYPKFSIININHFPSKRKK